MKIVLPTLHVRPSPQAVPLAAACLVAALPEALRRRAQMLDAFISQDRETLLAAILSAAPDLIAFPLYVWNRESVLDLVRWLKKNRPTIFLVAGGPEAATEPSRLLEEGLDAVIVGEGEETFRQLVEALYEGQPPTEMPGLRLRGRESKAKVNAPVRPAGEWPSPWLTGVLEPKSGGGVLWELSRGCPFACDFCYDGRGSSGVRHVPASRVEAEFDLFTASGVSQVWVLDSTFNFPPERGKKLLRLIAKSNPPIHFHFEAKADFLDREMARLLARIPCSVQIGLQSVRPEVLANIHRSFDAALFAEKMHLLVAEGVTFGIDLIYGLPGDDFSGFGHSLDTALGFAPNHVDIFPLVVLPGTPLQRDAGRFGIRAESRPPYRLLESATCGAVDLRRSRILAAATDLFYNLGRAVGFFQSMTRASGMRPAVFLAGFADWAMGCRGIGEEDFLDVEKWAPERILDLQEGYLRHLLGGQERHELLPAALDLLRFHFHHAEALLAPDLSAAPQETWAGEDLLVARWCRTPNLRLVSFSYEVLDLEALGEIDLEQFVEMFRPVGSLAVFFRREGEVFCESLEEDFARLLQGCDGSISAAEVFGGGVNRQVAEEIVEFALAEGFLLPAATG